MMRPATVKTLALLVDGCPGGPAAALCAGATDPEGGTFDLSEPAYNFNLICSWQENRHNGLGKSIWRAR